MDGSERVERAELGALATEHVAVGTGEKKTLALVAWKLSRTLDFASTAIVAGLFRRLFWG